MANLRAELINGLKNDAYKFYFIESEKPKIPRVFRELFDVEENLKGQFGTESNAAFNSNLKETGDGQIIESSDPTAGRTFVWKKTRYTDSLRVPRDLLERDAMKDAVQKMVANWISATMSAAEQKVEAYAGDLINFAGYSAGNAIFDNSVVGSPDPSGVFAYDGKPLLNLSGNNRTLKVAPKDGTTNSFFNCLGASGVDLTASNYDLARVRMGWRINYNDAGDKIATVPTHLIAAPTRGVDMAQILRTTTGFPGDANHGSNPFMGTVKPIEHAYLKNETAWYLYCKIPGAWKILIDTPFIDTNYDERTATYLITFDYRFGHLITSWRNIVAGNAPSS